MTITFDLNTRHDALSDQAVLDQAPLDTVMIVTALKTSLFDAKATPPHAQRSRLATIDLDDDDAITWEDAEWQ